MVEKRQSHAKKGKQSQKDLVLNLLLTKFHDDPEMIRQHLPEIAELLEQPKRLQGALFRNYLTERERQVRLSSLRPILSKFERERTVTREEAIKVLEDAAALKDHMPDKETIVGMVLDVFRIDKESDKKATIRIRNDLKKGQSYSLANGIELILSWDGKLLAIEINGKELARRQKALNFVGIARDPRSDVAEHHDTYAWEAFE